MSANTFIHDNFLLENKYAEELYHNYSKISQLLIITIILIRSLLQKIRFLII